MRKFWSVALPFGKVICVVLRRAPSRSIPIREVFSLGLRD